MITHYTGKVPFITAAQMAEIEKLVANEFGINLYQIMENAGLNLALLAKEIFLNHETAGKKIAAYVGRSTSGGGVLVAARRLHTWGAKVQVVLTTPEKRLSAVTEKQLDIVKKLKIPVVDNIAKDTDLILDGIFDYNLKTQPRGKQADFIRDINKTGIPVLALDAPSGLDLSTGKLADPSVKAKATMTLAIPKLGLFKIRASKNIGDIYLADVGIPPEAFESLDIKKEDIQKAFTSFPVVKINKLVVLG